jgi:hypothetical protein
LRWVRLGAIPLEDMDLVVNPALQELVGAHGDDVVCLNGTVCGVLLRLLALIPRVATINRIYREQLKQSDATVKPSGSILEQTEFHGEQSVYHEISCDRDFTS